MPGNKILIFAKKCACPRSQKDILLLLLYPIPTVLSILAIWQGFMFQLIYMFAISD